jgi:phosphoserine aminotransferase
MSDRVINFAAGPATLPQPVLEEVRRDLLSLPGVGASRWRSPIAARGSKA